MTSLPLSVLTSSIHFVVCWKELTSERERRGEKQEAEDQYAGDEEPQLWRRGLWQEDNKEVELQVVHILTKSGVLIWNF